MKTVLLVLISLVCLPVLAEEKTCTVNGMECEGCVGMVQEKLCTPENGLTTCEVSVVDKNKKIGQLHLVTPKDSALKLEPKALSEVIKDTGYKVDKCVAGAPKAAPAKAKKSS